MTATTEREVEIAGPTGSPAERFTSADPDAFAVPNGREEQWRFTPVRRLRELFQPLTSQDTCEFETELPDGVRLSYVGRDHPLVGSVLVPADRVSALAAANVATVVLVEIAANAVLDAPIVLRSIGKPGVNYGHFVISVGSFAKATLVMDHVGEATVAANVEVVLGDGADFGLISVQDWDPGAIHLAAHAAKVGRDAQYRHTSITLGGDIVRLLPTVTFDGPGGNAELYGLAFAGAGQHFESRLYVDHSVPNCTSNVVYKNALDAESARTVWIGDVRIRPAAIGTSTYELNRNLLLTDGARADSVPNLEIETGEITGAGHASATGRFDDLQLFYLQSRGIPEDEARRLVVRGFFADIVSHIDVPTLRDRLMASIDRRLGAEPAAESAE
ncbi:Fe-S cluster assembly protein SufD [Jatrophihabitans telluris]|uniref:Fe-S cluster assembly protein SufD n=1 Tax=Jatrophihabitans telluris TaxID=2038343 RepID=A0ABY4R595_9ACTN|nr:Fe-S cluster assembly protein SufD [Jatrophihabitans telluris]UQX90192.1 Fe-S cluster assembly protein SufD [Jatrophihabitans telluris]